MIALLLNHLWQSSLCVGGAGLMTLVLRHNGANARFWLWFAASIKFLVPFAALTMLGAYALAPLVPPMAAPAVTLIAPLAKTFSAPEIILTAPRLADQSAAQAMVPARPATQAASVQPAPAAFPLDLKSLLLALWAAGFLILGMRWLVRWSRVRALLRDATELPVNAPISVKVSPSRLEPGLVGILNPIILLPQGIEQQLSPLELQAVLAHELCHWRRRDNLLAAIHMFVEALFWFFPPVWWLGARLNAERERACDESVVAAGNDPRIYAEGILKICRAYLQSPLACVAGVSGADLKHRIKTILDNRLVLQLNGARKLVLSLSATLALASPLALGLLTASVTQEQAKATPLPLPTKTDERSVAQNPPPASLAAVVPVPATQLAQNPTVAQAIKTIEAAASGIVAAPAASPAVPPASPHETVASEAAVAPSDAPAQPAANTPVMMAQNDQPNAQGMGARQGSCTLPKLANTIELKRLPESDLVTAAVAINGKPKQFLLALTTNPTEVSEATVKDLGLPQEGRASSVIQSAGSGFSGNASGPALGQFQGAVYDVKGNQNVYAMRARVRLHDFTVGAATAHNMPLMVANDGEIAKDAPYDGLLTNALFNQYDVEVDFRRGEINYLTPTPCTEPDQVAFWPHAAVAVIPMTLLNGKIQVPVTIEGHTVLATIDTTSARSVMRRDIAELTLGYKANTPGMTPAGDAKDQMGLPVYAHTFSQISFSGGVTALNVPASIQTNAMLREDADTGQILEKKANSANARIPDLTLGMDVLHRLHLYAVFGQQKLYVTAAE